MDKIELYEKLGARKFQKVVFKVEKIKFAILRPFSGTIINFCEKRIDRKVNMLIEKENSFDKRQNIIRNAAREKLRLRIEFQSEKNRNYHINLLKPNEIITYLQINKKIHERGIIANFIALILSIGGLFVFNGVFIPILGVSILYNVFSGFINFECINLQNYNIERIERKLDTLIKVRERRLKKAVKSYGEVSKVLAPLISKDVSIPESKKIISNLTTKDELNQMKVLLDEVIKEKEENIYRRRAL